MIRRVVDALGRVVSTDPGSLWATAAAFGAPIMDRQPDQLTGDADDDEDRDHLTCCIDENLALCGADISGLDYTDSLDDVCSSCWRLFELHDGGYCPRGWSCPDFC